MKEAGEVGKPRYLANQESSIFFLGGGTDRPCGNSCSMSNERLITTPEGSQGWKPPGSRRSDGRIHWAPGISSDCKSFLVFFQFCPCSSSLWPMHRFLMQSREKYFFLCLQLPWSQSTLAASHQGRMGVPPSCFLDDSCCFRPALSS